MLWEKQDKQKQANKSNSWVARLENKEFTSSKMCKGYDVIFIWLHSEVLNFVGSSDSQKRLGILKNQAIVFW